MKRTLAPEHEKDPTTKKPNIAQTRYIIAIYSHYEGMYNYSSIWKLPDTCPSEAPQAFHDLFAKFDTIRNMEEKKADLMNTQNTLLFYEELPCKDDAGKQLYGSEIFEFGARKWFQKVSFMNNVNGILLVVNVAEAD